MKINTKNNQKEIDINRDMNKNKREIESISEWEEYLWQRLLQQLFEINSKAELNNFLSSILSNYERKMIVKRLNILLMLKENQLYREIGRRLWVSPNTIGSVRKSSLGYNKYVSWRSISAKNKLLKQSKQRIKPAFMINPQIEIFLDTILKGKTDMRARYRGLRM